MAANTPGTRRGTASGEWRALRSRLRLPSCPGPVVGINILQGTHLGGYQIPRGFNPPGKTETQRGGRHGGRARHGQELGVHGFDSHRVSTSGAGLRVFHVRRASERCFNPPREGRTRPIKSGHRCRSRLPSWGQPARPHLRHSKPQGVLSRTPKLRTTSSDGRVNSSRARLFGVARQYSVSWVLDHQG